MRHGGELRGNSYDRRRRKQWLLDTFGDGKTCACHWCNKRLTFETLTQDRVVPGEQGGRYVKSNLVPACFECNRGRHTRVNKPQRRFIPFWKRDYTLKEFLEITR